MTTPTNWPNPERPGMPLFPERDGWHALDTGQFIHVWHWYAKQKWWERKPNTDIAHEPKHFSHFLYIGPCLTPTQISELLTGERERAAQEAICIGESWDGTELSPTNTARDIAHAIRNLGAAP